MRGSQRVASHLLQLADAVVLHGVGQCDANARVVLVVAGALQFRGRAVEQKAALCIELHGTDAERRFVAIDCLAVNLHLGEEFVKVALFEGPQCRAADNNFLREVVLIARRDRGRS